MAGAFGAFVLGIVLLALGGDSLVKGASGLSRRYRVPPFLTGLVLVAFATSLPELAVNLRAMWQGQPALALGNAVGSNIVNFGMTLGAAAVAAPLLLRWRTLATLLLCLVLATVATIALAWDGVLGRYDGLAMLAGFVVVAAVALRGTRGEDAEVRAEIEAFTTTRDALGMNLARMVVAAALLYFGARLVVGAAGEVGAALGLGLLLTGLLPVAIGTALPEVAAAVAAARRGQGDLVAGHVIGASLFNLLLVVGGMAAFSSGGLALPASFVWLELPAALAFALVLYPMLRGDLRIGRGEGAILLAAFAGWIVLELVLLR
ncbi:MAG: sodium:calcium antiporter [Gammaproteobacteria bacterium]